MDITNKNWSVREYRRSHSTLLIELSDERSSAEDESSFQYVVFEDVIYFEGPLGWKPRGFIENQIDYRKQLFIKLKIEEQIEKSVYHLFSFLTELEFVHIIARRKTKFSSLPEFFAK